VYIFITVINLVTPDGEQSPRSKHSSESQRNVLSVCVCRLTHQCNWHSRTGL